MRQYVGRFDRVAASFGAWASDRIAGEAVTEAALSAVKEGGVPLFGKCDLLLVDRAAKEVRVVDYKTGRSYPDGEPEPAYARQLRFYRLLVENSPEYAGYRVTACENWYVEPDKETGEMRDRVTVSIGDAELAELEQLVCAVWERICASDYDTSAFEEKALKAEAMARKGSQKDRKRALQLAYEQWLVGEGRA